MGSLASFTKGLETVEKMAKDFSLDKIETITGVPAEEIKTLAKDFCAAETAVVYGRMGVSTQTYGGLCQWLVYIINIITACFRYVTINPVKAKLNGRCRI